eukprot:12706780-Alexandrium_andersonii.AAC.1
MPLQEGRQFEPEYAGYARVQVGVASGAPAFVMPGRLLGNRRALGSEASRKGVRHLAADGGRIPNIGEAHL